MTLEQYREVIFNEANKDAQLSAQGYEEAVKQGALIDHLGITDILVSPMRRAL